jgi:polysaccharide biosynthesis/export protein
VKRLSEYINKPEVMLSVQQVNSKKYFITGEITRPGPYSLVVPTTVLQAITNAGGFREWANQKKVVIMRGDKRLYFNYRDVVRGKNLDQNIHLEPGDHIIVP